MQPIFGFFFVSYNHSDFDKGRYVSLAAFGIALLIPVCRAVAWGVMILYLYCCCNVKCFVA
jgi:hypothetical protein